MFTSYTDRVLETYQKKKENGLLSLNLAEPTPSKLKQECSIVYSERYREKDGKTLRLFFLPKDDSSDYGLSIRNTDTDKFKPLSNFLKGRTSETEDKNIELLAWLIDFEPRPYNFKNNYELRIGSEDDNTELDLHEEAYEYSGQEDSIEMEKDKNKRIVHVRNIEKDAAHGLRLKEILIGGTLCAFLIFVMYLGLKNEADKREVYQKKMTDSSEVRRGIMAEPSATIKDPVKAKEKNNAPEEKIIANYTLPKKEMQCMYWKDDHYQEAFCDNENVPASLIAIDKNLVQNFKKITFPDTITEKSIQNIWYLKSDGKIEFFTHPGNHPVNNKKLKRMSKYILEKYVYNN